MPFSSATTWTSLSFENNSSKPRQPKSFRSLSWFIQFLLQNHIEACDFNTHSTWTWIFSLGIFIKASETELRRRDTDRFTLDHFITDCREKSTLDKKFKQLREYCSWKHLIISSCKNRKQTRKEQYKHNHFEGNQDTADSQVNCGCFPFFVHKFGKLEQGNNTLRRHLLKQPNATGITWFLNILVVLGAHDNLCQFTRRRHINSEHLLTLSEVKNEGEWITSWHNFWREMQW